jgi:predicted RNA-binding protein with PUA-like domain
MATRYWLMKSEPEVFSIDDLLKKGRTSWDGVRNYQARNYMRDDMKIGDPVLYYHSNAEPSGVAGLARVASEPKPDPTAWDKNSEYFDPKSPKDNPRWFMVDIEFEEKFNTFLPLAKLKDTRGLEEMVVVQPGSRLSVQPVTKGQYDIIIKLGRGR